MGAPVSERTTLIVTLILATSLTALVIVLSKTLSPNLYVTHGWLILFIIQVTSFLKVAFKKNRRYGISYLLVSYVGCLSISLISGLVMLMGVFDFLCSSERATNMLSLKPLSFMLWSLIYLSFFVLVIALALTFYTISSNLGLLIPPIAKPLFYERIRRVPFLVTFSLSLSAVLVAHYTLKISEEHLKLTLFTMLGLFMNLEASISLITQFLLLGAIVFIVKGIKPGIEKCATSSLLLGYAIGYLATSLVTMLLKQHYLKTKREIKSLYQLILTSTLMLLVLTFFVTGDLTVPIYLGVMMLYMLVTVVVHSSLSASMVNFMYLGMIGIDLMMPLFTFTVNSLLKFISETTFETSLSKHLFPSFAFLSLASLPGLLLEIFMSYKSAKPNEVDRLIKEMIIIAFISLIIGLPLMSVLDIVPSQYSKLITSSCSVSDHNVRTELVTTSIAVTTLFILLRGMISKFTALTFFTNPLTIPIAILLLNSEDIIFILAISSLVKLIFTASAYRYEELKTIYRYFKNYIVPISSGTLLAISILYVLK